MHGILPRRNTEEDRIVLGLLESVERGSARSQRRLAAELGIALGLVNLYLKRCVNKGLVKVAEAPARRYAYYLTPRASPRRLGSRLNSSRTRSNYSAGLRPTVHRYSRWRVREDSAGSCWPVCRT